MWGDVSVAWPPHDRAKCRRERAMSGQRRPHVDAKRGCGNRL
jgi:hypothetical protein